MTIQDRCVEAADLADDGRQRGRDDGLVERGQQQDEHEGGEDAVPLARAGGAGSEIEGRGRGVHAGLIGARTAMDKTLFQGGQGTTLSPPASV